MHPDRLVLVALRWRAGVTTFFRRPTVMQSVQSSHVFMHNLFNVKRSEAQAPHYEASKANGWTWLRDAPWCLEWSQHFCWCCWWGMKLTTTHSTPMRRTIPRRRPQGLLHDCKQIKTQHCAKIRKGKWPEEATKILPSTHQENPSSRYEDRLHSQFQMNVDTHCEASCVDSKEISPG